MKNKVFLVFNITPHEGELGLINKSQVLAKKIIDGYTSEHFLLNLDRFLKKAKCPINQLQGIIINSSGGFSQSRLIVTVANSLAYIGHCQITQLHRSVSLLNLVKLIPTLKWQTQVKPVYKYSVV